MLSQVLASLPCKNKKILAKQLGKSLNITHLKNLTQLTVKRRR
jgi:hypothetical protein